MAHTTDTAPSLLASQITKRLIQLRLSRREFVRQTGLSRQTLHNIEREGVVDLWPSTFRALDTGLQWPSGTASELARGNTDAIGGVLSVDDRISYLRNDLMHRIATMGLRDLESLVRALELQSFGLAAHSTSEHIEIVESRLNALEQKLHIAGKPIGADKRGSG